MNATSCDLEHSTAIKSAMKNDAVQLMERIFADTQTCREVGSTAVLTLNIADCSSMSSSMWITSVHKSHALLGALVLLYRSPRTIDSL